MITGFIVPASRRERADVGAPVAADLGLVAHAAERHPDELAPGRAGDRLADRGLAGAGRADQGQDGPAPLVLGDAAVRAQLAYGQVLRDAVLDVLEAGVIGVEHLARGHRVELLLGAFVPRHGDQPVQVGADHRGLARLLAHALEPAELLRGLLAHVVGHARLGDLLAVLLRDGAGVLAQLALDRLHLLAQEVLALLGVRAGLDVLADLLAQLELREPLALDLDGELDALRDVERLEHAHLLLEGDVGRVADRVGQRAGLDDRAQERRDALVGAAQLEDLLDDGAVLALGDARAAVDRDVVGMLGHLDAQAAGGIGVGGAGDAARDAGEGDGAAAAGQAHAVGDLGDRAHGGEFAFVAGDEQDARLVADVDGERDVHRGEDDGVIEGYEEESGHVRSFAFCSYLRNVCGRVAPISVDVTEIVAAGSAGAPHRARVGHGGRGAVTPAGYRRAQRGGIRSAPSRR